MKKLSTDYKNRCGHCREFLGKEDKFCRYCGTEAGKGEYKPYLDEMNCIYGPPPVRRVHRCDKCGYEWKTNMMIDDQKYCPKCGSDAPVIKEDQSDLFM